MNIQKLQDFFNYKKNCIHCNAKMNRILIMEDYIEDACYGYGISEDFKSLFALDEERVYPEFLNLKHGYLAKGPRSRKPFVLKIKNAHLDFSLYSVCSNCICHSYLSDDGFNIIRETFLSEEKENVELTVDLLDNASIIVYDDMQYVLPRKDIEWWYKSYMDKTISDKLAKFSVIM